MVNDLNESKLAQANALYEEGELLEKRNLYDKKAWGVFKKASEIYFELQEWERYINCHPSVISWFLDRNEVSQALKRCKKLLLVYEENIKEDTPLKGLVFYLFSRVYGHQKNYEKANEYLQLALIIYEKLNDGRGLFQVYHAMGGNYNLTSRYKEALTCYYKALKTIELINGENRNIGHVYYSMGYSYLFMEQFEMAKNYFQQALYFIEKYYEVSPLIPMIKNVLGEIVSNLGEYDLAMQYFQATLNDLEKNGARNKTLSIVLFHIGKVYVKQNDWKKALHYFQQAIEVQKKHNPIDFQWFVVTYGSIASFYIEDDCFFEAEKYARKGLEASNQLSINQYAKKADLYATYMRIFWKQNKLEEAIAYSQKAEYAQQQAIIQDQVEDYILVLSIKLEQVKIYQELYEKQKALKYLTSAIQLFPSIYTTIEDVRTSIFQEKDELNFNKQISTFYEQALGLLYEQYQVNLDEDVLEEMFFIAEKNKVHGLLSQLNEASALQLVDIPLNEKQRLQSLQSKIVAAEKKVQSALKTDNHSLKNQYAQELVEYQIAYHQLTQELERTYPNYLQFKNQLPTIDKADLQNHLDSKTALIEYEISQKHLYIFCWTQTELEVKRQVLPTDFRQQLNYLIDDGILGLNRKKYTLAAYQVYQLLLQPVENFLQQHEIQNLMLIPDGHLLELPFEALLTTPINYRIGYTDYPYLLQTYSIQYHYSATLWIYQQNRVKAPKRYEEEFVGFAPVYGYGQIEELPKESQATRTVSIGGNEYEALLYSEKEVEDIQTGFAAVGKPAKTYLRTEASLAHFKERLKESSVKYLHIAAHSVLNDREKELVGILFSPTDEQVLEETRFHNPSFTKRATSDTGALDMILSPNEVSQLQLQSDLVFLSCCKSGIGKIMEGEGMLSINRSFLYTGVSNIVFTLFKIYDAKTPILTHHFYKSILEENRSYVDALRYAKQQMIKMGIPPKFWSGFLLLGN